MKIAFFDFDGTITKDDSLLKFIRFVVGDIRFILGFIVLSPFLVAFKLKIIPNYKAKQIMLSYFFKGISKEEFKKVAREYSLNHINKILRVEAMQRIGWHQKQGHKVVVVSASLECWLKPWCEKNNLELISTKIEIKNGFVTGRLLTKNCHGQEKVNRIKENFNLDEIDYIYSYGDSNGDKEMLKLADEQFYKPFRKS